MNLSAVTTVAGLEVRQRIRTTRWIWTLAVGFLIVSLIFLGSLYVVVATDGRYADWAPVSLDIILGLVLFIGIASAPSISATSINGDRRDATLALVQATPITSWELTLGKLLGSWLASLTMVLVALPYLLWGMIEGYASFWRGLLALLVVVILLGCYCAVGLGFSALTSRPAASAMLTQATMLMLLFGTPLAFGLTFPAVESSHRVAQSEMDWTDPNRPTCREVADDDQRFTHTERTWWLLAANPVVIVSDTLAVGLPRADVFASRGASGAVAEGVSEARIGPEVRGMRCADRMQAYRSGSYGERRETSRTGHTWYLGLIATIGIGWLGAWTAARRLRVPAAKLPRGVRVA